MEKEYLKQIITNQFQINSLLGLIYDKVQDGNLAEIVDDFKELKKVDLRSLNIQ